MAKNSSLSASPVNFIETDNPNNKPKRGIALCFSGGGYRAMLFHLGTLWRINETGLLPNLNRISSVSGGSITAGLLGLKWPRLAFDQNGVGMAFDKEVVEPIRKLAGKTIDVYSVLSAVGPGTVSQKVADAYRKHLYGNATLQDLPDAPRFVFNATNVQSGALWRFMKPYMRDYRVGEIKNPNVELAIAVGASSAFPPFLSPVKLKLKSSSYTPNSGTDLQMEPYTSNVVLTDGGVYDNLGLETAWKRYDTILVSDAGGKMPPEENPKSDWARHTYRILDLVDNQVRSLRKQQVIDSFVQKVRKGTYWGIRTDISRYGLSNSLPCPFKRTMELAKTPTRLAALDSKLQEQIINWGYAVCDAALRKHFDPSLTPPAGFPYPNSKV